MKPREIKAEIIRQGLSLTDIANEAGTTICQLSLCISGNNARPYTRIRKVLAQKLGFTMEELFGDTHPLPNKAHKNIEVNCK